MPSARTLEVTVHLYNVGLIRALFTGLDLLSPYVPKRVLVAIGTVAVRWLLWARIGRRWIRVVPDFWYDPDDASYEGNFRI